MHRIDHVTRAEDLHGAGKDGFTEGDPVAGVAATFVTDDIMNAFQEEIANTIEARGEALDKMDNTQLRRLVGDALTYLEGFFDSGANELTYPATKTRKKLFGLNATALGVDGAGAPMWAVVFKPSAGYQVAQPIAGAARATAAVYLRLPEGATLTAVRVLFGKHTDHVTAADRWQFTLKKVENLNYSVGSVPASADTLGAKQDGGAGTGTELVEWTGLAEVIDNSDLYFVEVEGPSIEGANDFLYPLEVTFEDVGPRNF